MRQSLLSLFVLYVFANLCQAQIKVSETSVVVKDYDGNIYNTVQVGDQIWMAENLRTLHYNNGSNIRGCFSYDDNDSLTVKYGRLYTWRWAMNNDKREMTQGVCPSGWHLPSDMEWDELIGNLKGSEFAGRLLKEADTLYWSGLILNDSLNMSKMSFKGAGYFDGEYEYFYDLKKAGYFWTSSSTADKYAWARSVKATGDDIEQIAFLKIYGFSIRCVKDK